MRVRASNGGAARRAMVAIAATALVGGAACSSGDDSTEGTLGVITPGSVTTGSPPSSGRPDASAPVGTTAGSGAAGSGFVSIDVQVASAGIAESISLDRATLPAAALDPVSLDATCSPLDGAGGDDGVVVSVVDLRRLAGRRLVSAVLRYDDAAPGEHDMALEIGSADQVTTVYTGTVDVADDGMTGSFEGVDAGGTPVTGGFACAAEAVVVTTTTAVPLDAGEEVPDGSVPPPVSTVAPD